MRPEGFSRYWRWFFFAAALEAGAAFFVLLWVPHGGRGFSVSRLAVLGMLLGPAVLWFYLGWRLPRAVDRLVKPAAAGLAAILSLASGAALFLLRYLDPERLLPYYQRLNPLLFYLLVFFLQASVWILLLLHGFNFHFVKSRKAALISAGIGLLILLAVGVLIAITRLGLTPDPAYWGEPGVPVLGWQAALVLLAGLAVLLWEIKFAPDGKRHGLARLDLILVPAIWLAAVVLWLSVPTGVMQNSFYAPITPPANQPFPNSDAAYYDYHAQSVLLGMGYLGDIPTRPLYILFLAFLHALFGQNYGLILAGQTCVLALLPVVLYLLGARVHSRPAGVMIALFAIFRELTTLWISSNTRVVDTRTLMSDLPTTLMICISALMVMRWLERKSPAAALMAGGVFGALLLLRTQSIVILPFILLLALLAFRPLRLREWGAAAALFLLAATVTVLPWLIHNYRISGRFTFDDPNQLAVISSQYALTDNLDTSQFNNQTQNLAGNLIGFAISHPGVVSGFIANHFLATEIGALVALPLIEPFAGIGAPVNIYWFDLFDGMAWYNLLLLLLYLAGIAIGLGSAWKRLRWIGLTPLAFNLGYALANGIGRFSGWRYDLPADWIAYFYFSAGMAEIFLMIASGFNAEPPQAVPAFAASPTSRLDWRKAGLALAGLAFFGSLPWILEVAPSPHFSWLPESVLVDQMLSVPAVKALPLERGQVQDFLNPYNWNEFDSEILQGRVLYPRFYRREDGIVQAHPSPAYAVRDFARVGFLLMNQQILPVVFPTRLLPDEFPQGADVILLGCRHSQYIEAKLIVFKDLDLVYQNGALTDPCLPYDQ